jgi:hypothetical protein
MSCNLLVHEDVTEGKIPTTPTISSIIAGIQVQEAVKLIHGMPTLAGAERGLAAHRYQEHRASIVEHGKNRGPGLEYGSATC